jgi:GNAT superfamily N-acetyltransferase
MWWRLRRADFMKHRGERNREALKAIVESGEVPGILAYSGKQPIGWCAVAPRDNYVALTRSRLLKPTDDKPVWSVTCFFVDKSFRRRGLMSGMLTAAVEYVKTQGGRIVEGYPSEPSSRKAPDPFYYTGIPSAFLKAGFVEVAAPSPTRRIMRYYIEQTQRKQDGSMRKKLLSQQD